MPLQILVKRQQMRRLPLCAFVCALSAAVAAERGKPPLRFDREFFLAPTAAQRFRPLYLCAVNFFERVKQTAIVGHSHL
jgi:hypothetical protein